MMNLPPGYDDWKLASPEDDTDDLIECEECDAMVPEEELIPVTTQQSTTPPRCAGIVLGVCAMTDCIWLDLLGGFAIALGIATMMLWRWV